MRVRVLVGWAGARKSAEFAIRCMVGATHSQRTKLCAAYSGQCLLLDGHRWVAFIHAFPVGLNHIHDAVALFDDVVRRKVSISYDSRHMKDKS